ncbi:MAG: transporter related protein, partial [Candidatus Eremiobacteraeota bacterium]|nr:transporter related protein [Candidatus Eremiobacteraeota bacterium]
RAVWGVAAAPAPIVQDVRASAAGDGALACEQVAKSFGGVAAVDGVDLRIERGEIVGIVGPNGAGKSTLFDVISGFQQASGGRVTFDGATISGRRPDVVARGGVARTFQTSRLFATLTVWETALLAATSVNRSRSAAVAETARVLTQVGLFEIRDRLPDALPPGQQRLLEIARALALRPKVLLLDEAMAGMTREEIARVHAALEIAVKDGCSVVAIEHVLPAIATIAGTVHVLDFGRTIAVGPPASVFSDPIVLDAYIGVGETDLDQVAAGV